MSFPPLIHPDSLHLNAAMGWLELGNYLEANEELENITAIARTHPDVLEVRWVIYCAGQKFGMCKELGDMLITLAPDRTTSWTHRSAALHFLQRSEAAYDALKLALELFPKRWEILYDMACYASVTGRLEEAGSWLSRCMDLAKDLKYRKVDGKSIPSELSIRQLALQDPDLELIWNKIGELR